MTRPILLAAACLVVACAGGPKSMVGKSEADLRSSLGAPKAEYANRDGSRTLAYPTGPLGSETHMAEVSPSGTVTAVRQVLVEETFNRVNVGMKSDEVLRLIGPAGETMNFPRQGEVSWQYAFVDAWGYPAHFFVNLRDGVVVSKFTRRAERVQRP